MSLAAVSQGTQSLMGWIGLLLERLYEVYDNAEHPREGPALVLVDEIDVHMHPRWQQVIVPELSKLFPMVQFIAKTHSPLIIGGLRPTQVTCIARDPDGRVVLLPIEEDMVLGRADQILTSSLFGLETTLDMTTQGALKTMQGLIGKSARSPEEAKRLEELRRDMALRIPVSLETSPERRAYELVSALLSERIAGLAGAADPVLLEAAKQKLLDKTRQLMEEVLSQQGYTNVSCRF